jgi:hypothetical protein
MKKHLPLKDPKQQQKRRMTPLIAILMEETTITQLQKKKKKTLLPLRVMEETTITQLQKKKKKKKTLLPLRPTPLQMKVGLPKMMDETLI